MGDWSEEEIRNTDLMAPCGLYCGACGIYIATRDNNEKFRSILAKLYGTKPKDTRCYGCMQSEPPKHLFGYCQQCNIRKCVQSKNFYSCHQCEDWPCSLIEDFKLATAKNVINRTIPVWREKVAQLGDKEGSVEWARAECERYHCSDCGNPLFRGAQRCRSCSKPVAEELDGSL